MGCVCGKHKETPSKKLPNRPVQQEETTKKLPPANIKEEPEASSEPAEEPPPPQAPLIFTLVDSVLPKLHFFNFLEDVPSEDTERSFLQDWQKLLKEYCNFKHYSNFVAVSSSCCDNLALQTAWDRKLMVDLAQKILELTTRDWIREYLALIQKVRTPGNERSAISLYRKIIQLNQHFRWLVWAVSCYFFVSIGSVKNKKIGSEFIELSEGAKIDLPSRLNGWLKGFTFRDVKFKLVYYFSEQGMAFRGETKALRIFGISSEQTQQEHSMTFPMLVYAKIGPFLLYASPMYPSSVLVESGSLPYTIAGRSVSLPSEHLFKLECEGSKSIPYYIARNLSEIIPPMERPQLLCVFNVEGLPISISDKYRELPESMVLQILGTNKPSSRTFYKYGWDLCIYFDKKSRQPENPFATAFDIVCRGPFIVSASWRELTFPRFPVAHLDDVQSVGAKLMGIKACVGVLENTENIINHKSLKELIHRKGLNMRHEWIICAKCRSTRPRNLLETDLLARNVRNLVWHTMEEQGLRSLEHMKELMIQVCTALFEPIPRHSDINVLLFLSRLKCFQDAKVYFRKYEESLSRIIEPMKKKSNSMEYLFSDAIIDRVYKSARQAPGLFLSALELYTGVSLKEEVLSMARCDNYYFIQRNPILQTSDMESFSISVHSTISFREEAYITFLKYLEQTGSQGNDYEESFADWLYDSEVINKEDELHSREMILPCDLYSMTPSPLLKDSYDVPSLQILEEWASGIDALTHDLISVDGEESVLIEILTYVLTERYFLETDNPRCEEILASVYSTLQKSVLIPAEFVITYYLWSAIIQESTLLAQAEQYYVSALLLMSKLLGDPRGRGSIGTPWQMVAAWKLGVIAREERRMLDAQAADEHFDAVYMGTKQFQMQNKGKSASVRQDQQVLRQPFAHWSVQTESMRADSLVPESWDSYGTWMMSHSLPMYQSGKLWNNLYAKVLYKNTLVHQLSTQNSFAYSMVSGASTPTSVKESRRAMQQSSLTQVLLPENGALNMSELKGSLFIWGSGELGVGIGSVTLPYPRMMTSLKDVIIKDVAAGSEHCIAITLDGKCYAWGNNDASQLGLGPDMPTVVKYPTLIKTVSGISKAACGYQHSLLLTEDGKVFSMGIGDGGVLGHGNTHMVMYPKLIQAFKNVKIEDLRSGAYHNLALTEGKKVYVWGRGEGGQLGLDRDDIFITMKSLKIDSDEPFVHTPIPLKSPIRFMEIRQIACGEAHSLVLNSAGEVWGWGWGSNGQLGTGIKNDDFEEIGNLHCMQYTPIKIEFDEPIAEIAAGGLFSMFINQNMEVLACGMNDFGQLGLENPSKDHTDISVPTHLDCFSGYPIHKVFCGENHTLAVSYGQETMAWAWGKSREGQLGLGGAMQSPMPRPVQALSTSHVFKVACGRMLSVAVLGDPFIAEAQQEEMTEHQWDMIYNKKLDS